MHFFLLLSSDALSLLLQAPHHYVPTRSSRWSHGSLPTCPPTSLSHRPRAGSPRTCPCSPRSIHGARSPRPARRPSASAASRTRSTARRAWRSRAAVAQSSPSCSWWAWRRSSRSRSTCPRQTGQSSSDGFCSTRLDQVDQGFTDSPETCKNTQIKSGNSLIMTTLPSTTLWLGYTQESKPLMC